MFGLWSLWNRGLACVSTCHFTKFIILVALVKNDAKIGCISCVHTNIRLISFCYKSNFLFGTSPDCCFSWYCLQCYTVDRHDYWILRSLNEADLSRPLNLIHLFLKEYYLWLLFCISIYICSKLKKPNLMYYMYWYN